MNEPVKFEPTRVRSCATCSFRCIDSYGFDFCSAQSRPISYLQLFALVCNAYSERVRKKEELV